MENQGNGMRKESNKYLIISGIVIALFVIGLITNGFGFFSPEGQVTGRVIDDLKLEIGDSPVLGNANAPVTIYEFSDFSCPFCAAADGKNEEVIRALRSRDKSWEAPIPGVVEKYVMTGKVKIVFKYAQGHGTGKAAHAVGYALNEQGLFWQFKDLAFENQKDTGNIDKMKELAKSIGADMNKVDSYLQSKKYEEQIAKDNAMADANGIKGTPAFLINNRLIEGALSFSEFEKIIEKELSR